MKHRRLLALIVSILLIVSFTACSQEEITNTINQLRGELTQIKEDTVLENAYLGMTLTAPKGWWVYDLNETAFGASSGDPLTWAREEFDSADDFYMDMLYMGSQRDSSRTEHASFMIFVESFPDMESLEDFANLTAAFYDNTEDNYTTTNYNLEPLTHNGTSYYRADFVTTHPDNATDIICHYYVCQVQGLFVTVYVDYWEGEKDAMDAVLAVFDSLTITKGAQLVAANYAPLLLRANRICAKESARSVAAPLS